MSIKNHIKNKRNLFSVLLILAISTVIALTGVIQIDTFFDSSTGDPLTNVTSLLFECNDSACNSIGTQLFELNSGTTNQITFEYPFNPDSTSSNRDNFAHYFFKQCYIPKEFVESVFGFGVTAEFDYNFNKETSCHSPIDSFSVTNSNFVNEPVVIDINSIFEADAHSAFTNLLLEFVPLGFEDHYSAETQITLEITNEDTGIIVHTDTQTSEILMDTSQNFQFQFTPTVKGNYSARISSDVIDCQCQSSFEQFSEKNFVVLEERPQNECYALINDLKATPEFANQGDNITVKYNKTSNFADNSFVKTPVETRVTYEVTDSQNNVVFSDSLLLNANANGIDPEEISFNFTPAFGGDFNIKVTGVSENTLCNGKTNTADTAILGFFVESTVVHEVTFLVSDSQTNLTLDGAQVDFGTQTGLTDSSGTVVFNSNPGNFSFNVSLSGYDPETGTEDVAGDVTINVSLDPIAPFCGNNIIETGEQCDDGNTLNGDGCSNICEIEDDDGDGGSKKKSSRSRSSLSIQNFPPILPFLSDNVITGDVLNLGSKSQDPESTNILIWFLIIGIIISSVIILLVARRDNT